MSYCATRFKLTRPSATMACAFYRDGTGRILARSSLLLVDPVVVVAVSPEERLSPVNGYLDLLLTRPVDRANNEFVSFEREGDM